jgi:hypothetical protein
MFLSRLLCPDGRPSVIVRQGREAALLKAAPDDPAIWAGSENRLADMILRHGLGDPVDVEDLSAQGRLLLPILAGQAVHLPLSVAEVPLPLVLVAPGQPFQIASGLTLEGGIAALIPADAEGRVMGWVQFHLVTCAALGVRQLSFGPEMAIGEDRSFGGGPMGGGTGVLQAADGSQRSFPLPQVGTNTAAEDSTPPPGVVVLRRLSRWLIRPASAQGFVSLESRHVAAGLPLRNPLQMELASQPRPDAETTERLWPQPRSGSNFSPSQTISSAATSPPVSPIRITALSKGSRP